MNQDIRLKNPFHDPLMTELIENPKLYRDMFSWEILIGETLSVFQAVNVVLVGPQGSGKSMILNLIRYPVLAEWIRVSEAPPPPLRSVPPYFGISVNLQRASFHAFGRRSFSRAEGRYDRAVDLACAADFLNHYLFHEYLKGMEFLWTERGQPMRQWLGVPPTSRTLDDIAEQLRSWRLWHGFYAECASFKELVDKCADRLDAYRSFLVTNTNTLPRNILETKCTLEEPLHAMGNYLAELAAPDRQLPLFVVIDQYEVLPALNQAFGTDLQRIVNTLIKARDPVVFYKVGARTYDWGKELRVWGAESRLEVQRDYRIVNLSEVLMRNENDPQWLFPRFAEDIAHKRLMTVGAPLLSKGHVKTMFGGWSAEEESCLYSRKSVPRAKLLRDLTPDIIDKLKRLHKPDAAPLEIRLAGAWALQQIQRRVPEHQILSEASDRPWLHQWWKKERREIALLQIASAAFEKKFYYGWDTMVFLSGANVVAFLLICSEIWDAATKRGVNPLEDVPLHHRIQTEGVYVAAEAWRIRDRVDQSGGRQRFAVLDRLGSAIHDALIYDWAMSNPGHSGFSLRESELARQDEKAIQTRAFLEDAVSWSSLEERCHTSKAREGSSRRKWYLHPLQSPVFAIPHKRVKEPLYVTMDTVYEWVFGEGKVEFGRRNARQAERSRRSLADQMRFDL